MNIDKLLSLYVDTINEGKSININDLLKQCSPSDAKELKELIEMVDIFKTSIPKKNEKKKDDELFSHLEEIRLEKHQNLKKVSNYKTNQLTFEEKKKVEDKVDKLWEEEFGNE